MKKVIMGILSVLPLALTIIGYILNKAVSSWFISGETEPFPSYVYGAYYASLILFAASAVTYIIALIVYFVYNWKNQYIYPDKKIGWGYMIVCVGILAMPAYWYNFIRKK